MPAIAAIDNETLDHLLSVVDDARNLTGVRALSKPGPGGQRWDARVAGEMRVCAPNRGRPLNARSSVREGASPGADSSVKCEQGC